jgi:peptidoglycan/xylan/chitin deacetylase (PgdA/CDA1 family)
MSPAKAIKLTGLWLARALGLFWLGRLLTRRGLLIIGWHGVSMDEEHVRFRTLFISQATFRRRLEYLRRTFRVISLEEALQQHERGHFDSGQVVLTFDDGYFNFQEAAAPILRQFEMPATVYLVTGNMALGRPYESLVIRDAVGRSELGEVLLPLEEETRAMPLTDDVARRRVSAAALACLDRMPHEGDARLEYCRRVTEALAVDFDAMMRRRTWTSLNPEEARHLAEEGFGMQLHSHTHRHVTDIPDELADETRHCRELVEQATGRPATDYCYPGGFWERRAWGPLREAGVRSATTVRNGPNFPQTPVMALRRFLDGEALTQLEFEFELSNLRWLLYVLLHPSRRHEPSEKRHTYAQDGVLF